MAKRNKTKFASKGRKSALRIETLEQRQLLATITGAGIEVGSNILHQNGNVYDQVLMTGSSVTVTADPGQVTRVSFLDLQGDIVQAELSGAGTLTVSMDPSGYQTNVAPENYNQAFDFVGPDGTHYTGYVEGLASFTIQGSDSTTNIAIFSVGSVNAVNTSLFDDTHVGGDHVANVQKLVIVADPAHKNGSTFGSIFAGDTIFEGSSGTVGIAANNVQVQGTVTIGNIDASDSGVPTLAFGASSQFGNVDITLGNLASANGAAINDGNGVNTPYAYGINFVDGTDSAGRGSPAQVIGGDVTFTNAATIHHNITTIDTSTDITIDDGQGNTISQAELDALFLGRTFANNVTIHGVLEQGFYIDAAAFQGTVTFTGDIDGNVTLHNINHTTTPTAVFAGTVTFDGNVAGVIAAESFKNVTVEGNFAGVLDTGSFYDSPGNLVTFGGIGNVTVMGDFSGELYSATSIGNVLIDGDLLTTAHYAAFLTLGGGDNNLVQKGDIGTITIEGDVNQTGGNDFLYITNRGTFGNVTINGKGDASTSERIGTFFVTSLAAGEQSIGTITVNDLTDTVGSSIDFGGVVIDSNVGAVGAITIAGGGVAGTSFTLGNEWGISGGSVGNITISGFSEIDIYSAAFISGTNNIHATNVEPTDTIASYKGGIGNISLTTIDGTIGHGSEIYVSGNIDSVTSIGTVTVHAGDTYSSVELNGNILALTSIGAITVSGEDITLGSIDIFANNYYALFSNGSMGDVTFTATGNIDSNADFYAGSMGQVTMTADGSIHVGGYIDANTLAGVTVDAGTSISDTSVFGAYVSVGDVSLTAGTSISVNTNDGLVVGDYWNGTGGSGVHQVLGGAATIGNVTLTANGGDIYLHGEVGGAYATSVGNVTLSASGSVTVHSDIVATHSIGNVSFTAGDNLYTSGTVGGNGSAGASATVGDVTFTADDGCLTLAGWIGNSTTAKLGAVSLTAHGYVTVDSDAEEVYYGGGDVTVTCAGAIYANDSIASVTVTAESGGSICFNGAIGSAGGDVAIGQVAFNADTAVWNYAGSVIEKEGSIWIHGQIGTEGTDTIAGITAHAYDDIATGCDGNIYAYTSVGAIGLTADTGSIWLHGNIHSENTLGNITVWAGDDLVSCGSITAGNAGNYETSSLGNVSFTAQDGNLTDSSYIASGTLGNVTMEATAGTLSVSGEILAALSVGNASFTAGGDLWFSNEILSFHYGDTIQNSLWGTLGDVSFTSTGGDVHMSGGVVAGTIASLSLTADAATGSNYFSGAVWGLASLGDVTVSAGSDSGSNQITGFFYADTAANFTFNGATVLDNTGLTSIFYGSGHVSNIHVTTADVITFSDAATLNGAATGEANISIGWGVDSVVAGIIGLPTDSGLLHGLSFDGDTTLNNTVLDSTHGNIDGGGDAGGVALHFTNLTTNGDGTLLTHTVGDAVFDGNTVLTGGTFWVANDHTAALDTIGNLTFNGTVTGVHGVADITASKIGNITINGSLDLSHKVLVTDFNVFAGNNTSNNVGVPGEALSSGTDGVTDLSSMTDGSNINEFTIGNITVQDNQTFGYSGTALFGGSNSFDSIGGVGNVKLIGGGSVTKEDALATNTGTVRITAGVFGSAANAVGDVYGGGFDLDGFGGIGAVYNPGQPTVDLPNNLPPIYIYGVDPFIDHGSHYDGNGPVYGGQTSDQVLAPDLKTAANNAILAELGADFSSAVSVSIGNIEIQTAMDSYVPAPSQHNPDTIANATGLTILSGVNPGEHGYDPTKVNAAMSGSIGNVFVHNLSQVLDIYNSAGQALPGDVNYTSGDLSAALHWWNPGVIAGTSVGTIQTLSVTWTNPGDAVILGRDLQYNYPGGAQSDEIVVIVV